MKKLTSFIFIFGLIFAFSICDDSSGTGTGCDNTGVVCGGGSNESCEVLFLDIYALSCEDFCDLEGYDYAKSLGTDPGATNGMIMTCTIKSTTVSYDLYPACLEKASEVQHILVSLCEVKCGNGEVCTNSNGYGICLVPATVAENTPWTYCKCCN